MARLSIQDKLQHTFCPTGVDKHDLRMFEASFVFIREEKGGHEWRSTAFMTARDSYTAETLPSLSQHLGQGGHSGDGQLSKPQSDLSLSPTALRWSESTERVLIQPRQANGDHWGIPLPHGGYPNCEPFRNDP